MIKQEFATLVVAMQAMYGEDFIGTEEASGVSEYLSVRKYRCGSGEICRNLRGDPKAEKNRSEHRKCIAKPAGNGAGLCGVGSIALRGGKDGDCYHLSV